MNYAAPQNVPIIVFTLIFLVLFGLLWYERPNPTIWLFGSIFLGAIWGGIFLRLITRIRK